MAVDKLDKLRKKSIEIKVEEEPYYLRYDLNALVKLEESYGDIEKAFDFENNPGGAIGKLRKVLFVGLQANHKELTEEDVGNLFTLENLSDFQAAIGMAMEAAMPEEDKAKNRKTPKDHMAKAKTA
jgi:hypothetical protein